MSKKKQATMEQTQLQFYSLDNILTREAHYNIVFGERSNGKTYSVLKHGLEEYVRSGKQMVYLRRYDEDIRGRRGDVVFSALTANGVISELTNGEYNFVKHINRRFYLAFHDPNISKDVIDNKPFCFSLALNNMEHDKSTSYPDVTTICFDEFLDRRFYLNDEFVLFTNCISTIVRHRNDVKIFMLGNTVNQFGCPYFKEMGLHHASKMKQGTIEVYQYGKSPLKVAVEYADNLNKEKPSDVYFAFDNPKLQMITGGVWEMALYPHLPVKYRPNQVLLTYFIEYEENLLQCEIVNVGDSMFTFIHRKTTPLKDPDKDIVYSLQYNERPNYARRLLRPVTKWQERIAFFFKREKVFYQDNEVGEIVRNYLNESSRDKIV